ncbi:DUF1365 domain-containing protein [Knoellia subterranea]|uniref:DUF1365 domain-containing protein n=1 Tax=Knoellia subterranea KCTC 19937 TaxID=1385521 RepID=A0A0A0JFN6_9MICO|nr:DUF1365 domain-containing protein [Knoellia subterranea]KGN36260.1 hypothetical protein N803_05210 [Knoellia subterranea KCTC 19937]
MDLTADRVSTEGLRIELPSLPALVVGRVHHTRPGPVRHSFTHRHYQWLIDLDEPLHLPRWLKPVASFRPEDHLAGEESLPALKANVLRCLERAGIPADGVTRVVALTHARVLGHVFDPMTAYWCLDEAGLLRGVVIEVHNTYGGRHAYAVQPDRDGLASVDKDFYVSPFNDTSGEYAVQVRLTEERVRVGIRLRRDGELLMTAVVDGAVVPATSRSVIATVLRHPFMPQRVSALIRFHGIRLWARRLPVQPRPAPSKESVR